MNNSNQKKNEIVLQFSQILEQKKKSFAPLQMHGLPESFRIESQISADSKHPIISKVGHFCF